MKDEHATATKVTLRDQDTCNKNATALEAAIIVQPRGFIAVELEGHGLAVSADNTPLGDGNRTLVMLEVWEGKARCLVWADINKEDPTHIIELDRARICRRECPTCGQIASHDPGCDEDISPAFPELQKYCPYCSGTCPTDRDHACDGYLGDIDGLSTEEPT